MFTKTNSQFLLLISGILLIIFSIFLSFINADKNQKIVYVNSQKIFEDFKMSGELKLEAQNEFDKKKVLVDSLYEQIAVSGDKEAAMQKFLGEKQNFEDFVNRISNEQSKKIWSRISGYSKDFVKEHNYAIILGGQPGYNIIAGNDSLDVTNDFLIYINKKYEGN